MSNPSKPIQARITVELFPRGGCHAPSEVYSFDYYLLDNRLMAQMLKDYLLPVSAAVDTRLAIPRADIGSDRDSLLYFPDRAPAVLSEITGRLEDIRHFVINKLPDPYRILF